MKTFTTQRWSAATNWLSIFTSVSTLVCCALPALLVGLGAGATLISLTSTFPQLIWLSEHKIAIFIAAGLTLGIAGVLKRFARRAPCPTDPRLARACSRQRKISRWTFVVSCGIYVVGGFFAFVAPSLL